MLPVPSLFYTLAFAEETRAPVESHLYRPFLFAFGDMVLLVARRDRHEIDEDERESKRSS